MTSGRLRLIGTLVLVVGLAAAPAVYWVETRSATPTLDELMPGYSEHRARLNAIQMGELVVTLLAMADAMKEPRAQALLIAGVSVLVAVCCFRIAPLLDRRPDD
jgi:hypothetical protein